MPVVGREIRAPDLDALGFRIGLDGVVAAEAGNAEERRGFRAIAKGCRHRGDAVVDFLLRAFERHPLHVRRMILGVGGNRVAGIAHPAHAFRIGPGLRSDQEEGRLHALRGENIQHLIAVLRDRAVVEGQHHLMILQRQRLGVLHGADDGIFAWIDHDRARRAERVGMAGTIGGRRILRDNRCQDRCQDAKAQRGQHTAPGPHTYARNHKTPASFQRGREYTSMTS